MPLPTTGSIPYSLGLTSETTIYVNEVKCRVLENDFNYSQNPTVFITGQELTTILGEVDPSPDAFVSGIMEGKEWVWEGGILREKLAESTQRRINTLVDKKVLDEHKVQLFQDFLANL
jgi:hypothetical protein